MMESKPLAFDETARSPGVPSRRGHSIVFTGSTPNIGTTLLALGTALQLAALRSFSVGLLCLNLKSSKLHRYLGKDESRYGLDFIRAEMRSCSLNPQRMMNMFEPVKGAENLQVLFGTQQREQAEFFQPDDIRHLLRTAREVFDVIVVDVSAYWDNAATITALMDADRKVLVTTPDLGHFQEDLDRGLKTLAPLFGIAPESFLLAVNQYSDQGAGGIRVSDIRKETGMALASVAGFDPGLRGWMNQGRLLEYASHNRSFAQSVEPLAKLLADGLESKRNMAESLSVRSMKWLPIFNGR